MTRYLMCFSHFLYNDFRDLLLIALKFVIYPFCLLHLYVVSSVCCSNVSIFDMY